ncbi:MAG: type II toxin-antitoxin system prevent-host-death family antitoxin [bacterium]
MSQFNIPEMPLIVSFEKFRAKMAEIIEMAREKARPVFLTKKGETQGVVMDPNTYENLSRCMKEWTLLEESVTQVKRKKTAPADKVFNRVLDRYN